jgi:hypothetical protein
MLSSSFPITITDQISNAFIRNSGQQRIFVSCVPESTGLIRGRRVTRVLPSIGELSFVLTRSRTVLAHEPMHVGCKYIHLYFIYKLIEGTAQCTEFHVSRYGSISVSSTALTHTRLKGGDFLKGDGTGSFSIYGDKFPVNLHLF